MNRSLSASPRSTRPGAGLAVLLCLTALAAQAGEAVDQMYECNQDGAITFSQQPCAGQERKVDVEYDRLSPDQTRANDDAAQDAEAEADVVAQATLLDNQILAAQQQISQLQTERDARLAEMKQQQTNGTEGLDQAAWMAQTNQQMESVYQDYSARIVTVQAQLNDFQARRAALGGPIPGTGAQ